MNNYIKHYLERDKTNSAIMLKGKWGVGKSYYINNRLEPFLSKGRKRTCVIVSLYGIESLSDISRSIFAEVYGSKIPILVRSMLKDIIDSKLPFSDQTLNVLYEQCDLKGKLLVFEDLERSEIDIDKILGCVSNLVEKGAKVLFVANEDEILKSGSDTDSNSKEFKYRRAKEKVISDTIEFSLPIECAVKDIVEKFQNHTLSNLFSDDDKVKNMGSILKNQCNSNLRTFICCCQKSVGIIEMVKNTLNDNRFRYKDKESFYKCIFNGTLYFLSKNKKEASFPNWSGSECLSPKLGSSEFPLTKMAYDYIVWQRKADTSQVASTYEEYENFKFYRKNDDGIYDRDISIIYGWANNTEHNIRTALASLEKRLENNKEIPFHAYPKLAYFIPMVSGLIDYDYGRIRDLMIKNVRGLWKEHDINTEILFCFISEFCESESESIKNQVNRFVQDLSDSINYGKNIINFSYNPNDIEKLYADICSASVYKYTIGGRFISKFDVDRIVKMLGDSTSKQISDFKGILLTVYRNKNKLDLCKEDIRALEDILKKIEKLPNKWDKIQLWQINSLCNNIKNFLKI